MTDERDKIISNLEVVQRQLAQFQTETISDKQQRDKLMTLQAQLKHCQDALALIVGDAT